MPDETTAYEIINIFFNRLLRENYTGAGNPNKFYLNKMLLDYLAKTARGKIIYGAVLDIRLERLFSRDFQFSDGCRSFGMHRIPIPTAIDSKNMTVIILETMNPEGEENFNNDNITNCEWRKYFQEINLL